MQKQFQQSIEMLSNINKKHSLSWLNESISYNPQQNPQQQHFPKIKSFFKEKAIFPYMHKSKKSLFERQRQKTQVTQYNNLETLRKSPYRSKQQINNSIKYSVNYIETIQQKNKKPNKRWLTQTLDAKQENLYSYLQRDYIMKRQLDISDDDVDKFYNQAQNKNHLQLVLQKSRKFLKNAVVNDARKCKEVRKVFLGQSKSIISEEVKTIKEKFTNQYKMRNNSPYFSFLSLSRAEKASIMSRNKRKSFANHQF